MGEGVKWLCVVIVLVCTNWFSFMMGVSDVKRHTVVGDIWEGRIGLSRAFYGECFSQSLCAMDSRR